MKHVYMYHTKKNKKTLTHADVFAASPTPDVVWHFKANDKDALAETLGAFSQGMRVAVLIDGPMLCWVKVWWVVTVDGLPVRLWDKCQYWLL